MSVFLSMAAFALAASISPGPVNIVALCSGARHGFVASLWHVTGATLGFTALLLFAGFGLRELLLQWPGVRWGIQCAGVVFLLFMAWKLASDSGEIRIERADGESKNAPSLALGALMQWLNPKAWLAAIAGVGAYAAAGEVSRVWQFALIYFVICYLSIACWAWMGSRLRHCLNNAGRVRRFNWLMALLLLGSAFFLIDL